jgi:hypothetical protein
MRKGKKKKIQPSTRKVRKEMLTKFLMNTTRMNKHARAQVTATKKRMMPTREKLHFTRKNARKR